MARPLLLLLSMLLPLLWGCPSQTVPELHREQLQLGTLVEISVIGAADGAEAATDEAFAEIDRVEKLFSPHLPESEVSRFNALPVGGSLELGPETTLVLTAGLQLMRQSDGAFDPALGRLIRLWDIEGERPRVPTAPELEAVRNQRAAAGALRLRGRRLTKLAPVALDFGAIGKGYAIDRAAAVLRRAGIEHASINAGGDLYLIGSRPERPWRIAIQHPRQPGTIAATLDAANEAVVTSGDYERYFERNGVRYHHLFDPASGEPARRCQSVTVIAPSAMLADGLATAVFVLGPERGLELLRQVGMEGVVIDAAGRHHQSPGLDSRLQWR